jgi:hypothetical protein
MRTIAFLLTGLAFLAILPGHAQFWNRLPGGNNITSTEWLGADVGSTVPFRIETRANQPIDLYTNAVRRIMLQPDATYNIGSYPTQVKNGHMLLSPSVANFIAGGPRGPYSILHLAAATNSTQQASYRPWMGTGMTLTGNADHQYVGQKPNGLDATDMVVHWSDNPGEGSLKDRLRFLFTSGVVAGAQSGAQSPNLCRVS